MTYNMEQRGAVSVQVNADLDIRASGRAVHSTHRSLEKDDYRPLRLALVASSYVYIRDGVALTLNRLVEYLQQHGVEVLVFSPVGKAAALEHHGTLVPVPSVALPGRPEYRLAFTLPRSAIESLRAFRPDLMHIALAPDPLGYSALRQAQRLHIPVVASCHTRFETYLKHYRGFSWLMPPLKAYLRHAYGACREVYVPSRSMIDVLLADGLKDNFRLWPRGVDTTQFDPAARSSSWRAEYGIGEKEFVVAFVSRLVREKELATLVATLQRLQALGISHRSLIVGDGPERVALESQLPQAIFTGSLEGKNLAAAYASSDVFVFPSETETFGNVTLEAMASGLPCVCANATGSDCLVADKQTGYLVAPRCVDEFVDRIVTLAADPALRARMGMAARQRSLLLTWDQAMARILGYYRSLLAESPP